MSASLCKETAQPIPIISQQGLVFWVSQSTLSHAERSQAWRTGFEQTNTQKSSITFTKILGLLELSFPFFSLPSFIWNRKNYNIFLFVYVTIFGNLCLSVIISQASVWDEDNLQVIERLYLHLQGKISDVGLKYQIPLVWRKAEHLQTQCIAESLSSRFRGKWFPQPRAQLGACVGFGACTSPSECTSLA